MINELYLLKLKPEDASTKQKIISVLSAEWPLTTKQIFERLQREYSAEISYQAVHKVIKELQEDQVIERKNEGYQLNVEWLQKSKKTLEDVEKRYMQNKKIKIPENFRGTIEVEFDSFSKLTVWSAELFASRVLVSDGDNTLIGYMRYGFWPLTFNFNDFLLLLRLLGKSANGYPILKNRTPFGEWVMGQYMKAGAVKGTFDNELDLDHDVFIHGDCLVEVFTEPKFDEYMKETYNKIKNLNDLFQNFTTNKEPQTKIRVVITKNPDLAKFLKREALRKYFS